MKRSDATAALSWANDTRATSDTRITATEFRVLCVIAGGCRTRAEISAAAGCGESTVPRAVRRLEKIKALKRVPNPGKANGYVVQVRADTGVTADTGIATGRASSGARISQVRETSDTGATADTGQAVDNAAPHIEHAGARGKANLKLLVEELSSETVELNNTPPRASGASLVQRVCDLVNSPWLDPNKSEKLSTKPAKLARWATQLDVETELVPVLQAKLKCNGTEPIGSWNYFEFAVNDFIRDKNQPQENTHDQQRTGTHSYASAGKRRPRSVETEILMRDILDDSPRVVGRVDFSAGK